MPSGQEATKRSDETDLQWRGRLARERDAILAAAQPAVTPEAEQHGEHAEATIANPDGPGARRVMVNRATSVTRRWWSTEDREYERALDEGRSYHRQFEQPARDAIEHCERLWARVEGNASIIAHSGIRLGMWMGEGQQNAMDELSRYQAKIPRPYWSCFENVCRFDEPTGAAGSRLANNNRSAVDAAKLAVAFVAAMIAMWKNATP